MRHLARLLPALVVALVLGALLDHAWPPEALGYSRGSSSPVAGAQVSRVDRQGDTPFIASITTVTATLTESAILGLTPFYMHELPITQGASAETVRATAFAVPIFSAASLTATVEVWRVYIKSDGTKGLKGRTTLSFTAGTTLEAGGYWDDEQYVSSSGAVELRFVIKAFSGTGGQSFDLRVGSN